MAQFWELPIDSSDDFDVIVFNIVKIFLLILFRPLCKSCKQFLM